ncbi:hypothetical protein E1301_Tti016009 [Triplophysa tibetana]|uniref:Uncharacterized protein n=1 Tax=Triplophysa tibetana TaxID=1572043 RepID=A0A5A9PCI2_9TELE|nr:hypothetical protein E1301_Tti016009 [Triplophysa tibetana]
MKFACRTPPPEIRYKRKPACSIHLPFVLQSHRLMNANRKLPKFLQLQQLTSTLPDLRPVPADRPSCSDLPLGVSAVPVVSELKFLQQSFSGLTTLQRGMSRCSLGCGTLIEAWDGHERCVRCLGVQHAEAAFVDTSCPHCGQIVIQKLRSRLAVFLREPANISSATRAMTSMATAQISGSVSGVSDLGNPANVHPPAKRSRAGRTPARSFDHSPTGGGTPSGSSSARSPGPLRTRHRPRCTPRLHPGRGLQSQGPLLVSNLQGSGPDEKTPGKTTSGPTVTIPSLTCRYGTIPASFPKPGPYQGLAPTCSKRELFPPGVHSSRSHTPPDCARRPDLTPWRGKKVEPPIPPGNPRHPVGSTRLRTTLRGNGLASGRAYACESTIPPSLRLGQCAIYPFLLTQPWLRELVPHQPPFLPTPWLRTGIPSITKQHLLGVG